MLPSLASCAVRRPWLPLHRAPRLTTIKRLFSARVDAPRLVEQVRIPCRSNGHFTIDIFPPSSYSASSPTLIYLPSGPVIPESQQDDSRVVSALSHSSGATIARINYRLSPEHLYPTAVHDVTVGYDWVLENLLSRDPTSSHRKIHRIGVCGELVGGSLATMLALTECNLVPEAGCRLGAAAVNNPIVDWVFPHDLPEAHEETLPDPTAPEETAFPADQDLMIWWNQQDDVEGVGPAKKTKKQSRKPAAPSPWKTFGNNDLIPTLTLSGERDVLFRKPEDYFDRFISPIHFFRSPHGHLRYPKTDNDYASAPSDIPSDPYDFETQLAISHFDSVESEEQVYAEKTKEPVVPTLERCRAYARIYPPAGTNLWLPRMHITMGAQSPLLDQSNEFAKMMKRSIARQTLRARTARAMWQDPAEKAKYEAHADTRVRTCTMDGIGLWTEADSEANLEQVGAWMREALLSNSA